MVMSRTRGVVLPVDDTPAQAGDATDRDPDVLTCADLRIATNAGASSSEGDAAGLERQRQRRSPLATLRLRDCVSASDRRDLGVPLT